MNRNESLQRLQDKSEHWDLLVIGGGATGLGIALDAANRGHRTALLEMGDFGEGTSSRSTKLIHGGVRYLRNGDFALVRESLRERGHLLRNAPNLVTPLPFAVPAYRWHERFYYGAGLRLYDFLAGDLGIGKTGHLGTEEIRQRIPNLGGEGLRGGTLYWDGQFDDARLIVALVRSAAREDAALANYVKVESLTKQFGKVSGAIARDRLTGDEFEIRAKAVVNATGVFSDDVRRMDEPGAARFIAPSQGIHLVLDREFLGGETAIMIPKTDDGRVLFAIPWYHRVLLGTTDTAGVEVTASPKPLDEEIDYLLDHAARYLVRPPARSDVRASFAGLRPLVRPSGGGENSTAEISRSHSLVLSDSGLLTVAGGKWTTYRQMAEDAIDRLAETGWLPERPCRTEQLRLHDLSGAEKLIQSDPSLIEELDPDLPYTLADVAAAVREEMAVTVEDVLHRRTRSAFLDEAATRRCAGKVAAWMEKETGKPVPAV